MPHKPDYHALASPAREADAEDATAVVVWDESLLGYDFGAGHPMAPTRLDLTMRLVRDLGLLTGPGVRVAGAPVASDDVLGLVHDPQYIAAVKLASTGVADPARGLGTEDDPVFAGMHEAAARIVTGSLACAQAVWSGQVKHAVNVAGGMHHAKADGASGFCIYSDAAVAIAHLLDQGAQRVAYVDLDAHHGDGVEAIFWNDPRVLTISLHQNGATLFPGTGSPGDTGGPGAPGGAVNVALPPRTDGPRWLRALEATAVPVLRAFEPQVLVTQHGCDAHGDDPLSDLRVGVGAQRAAAAMMHTLAHTLAGGRWIALGGGGYVVERVVPLVWASVVAEVVHRPINHGAPLPQVWCEHLRAVSDAAAPHSFGDGVTFRPWAAGFDPSDDVDRAVMATRKSAFPHHGLDPYYD